MSEFICNEDERGGMHLKVPVEEIVRCADCRFFDTRECKSQWPFNLGGYCWWGERKETA